MIVMKMNEAERSRQLHDVNLEEVMHVEIRKLDQLAKAT